MSQQHGVTSQRARLAWDEITGVGDPWRKRGFVKSTCRAMVRWWKTFSRRVERRRAERLARTEEPK